MPTPPEETDEVLAARVDAAVSEHEWEHQIANAVVGDRVGDDRRERLADAFRFHARDGGGHRFAKAVIHGGGARLATLDEVDDETSALWKRVADLVTEDRAICTLHDLLFEKRSGNVGQHLAKAIDAYQRVAASTNPASLAPAYALDRARELAAAGRDAARLKAVADAAIIAATDSVDVADPKPGIVFRLLEVVIAADPSNVAVDALLTRVRLQFRDAWNTESAIELQRRRAPDGAARKALDRELVEAWLSAAANSEPLVAVIHREKAATLARQRGLGDLFDRAVREMQAAGPPELARIRTELPEGISDEDIEAYITSLVGDSWWNSVLRIVAGLPPTGLVDSNRQLAADLAKESPLQNLFPKVKLGSDGLPRYSPQSEEDKADDQLADVEAIGLSFHGRMMAEALRRAGLLFQPTKEEMFEALQSAGCDSALSAAVTRVLVRFNEADFEAAAVTALPIIERVCRNLLLEVDAAIYRVQREKTPGTYAGLGTLLPLLAERGLDESWYRFLRTLLTAPNGWNLRNETLHGFVENIGDSGAGLILIALLHLCLLRPTTRTPPSASSAPADDLNADS